MKRVLVLVIAMLSCIVIATADSNYVVEEIAIPQLETYLEDMKLLNGVQSDVTTLEKVITELEKSGTKKLWQ